MTIAYDLDGAPVDTFSHEGAIRLAVQIVTFWRGRGKAVQTKITREPMPYDKTGSRNLFCVRSNLINGLPR